MIRMRCLRAHASTLWGAVVDGEVFDVDEGYVAQLEEAGLAERVEQPAPAAPEAPDEDLAAALASLQAPAPVTIPTRRGRRG